MVGLGGHVFGGKASSTIEGMSGHGAAQGPILLIVHLAITVVLLALPCLAPSGGVHPSRRRAQTDEGSVQSLRLQAFTDRAC